ncbi:cytochrome P450 [Mycobacterium vicinigordonae]|uniref:Cytochrome P450 n=1 Tax=Mycobacterium vicinigordonae TaxID=1719132 RepID=A0A7D6IQU5_9MYCO|nr:cytochrome P450 [Mycobacterium vicinigordonae]QLL06599.1 cytochrome P450 [Mycobacterium vicinigordonae]
MDSNERYVSRLAPLTLRVKGMASPQPVYHQKAKDVRAERAEAGVVTLYRRDDVVRINRHPAVLGAGGRGGNFGNDNPLIPLEIDGEDHKKWRQLLDPLFAPKPMARLEGLVRKRAAELVDGFADAGTAELYEDYCVPLPCLTFLEFVGAPAEDIEFFVHFKDGVLHPQGNTRDEIRASQAASGATLVDYFSKFFTQRRAEGVRGDDVLAVLLRSQIDGRPLTDAELLNIIYLLMFAGLDTVTASMSCLLAWLGQHPHECRRLAEDPARIPAAVEELMRHQSPAPSSIRYATADIDLGDGLTIQAGEAIHVSWAAANVDPTAYPDPLRVDFERGRFHHLAFGSGVHRCLGSHLARLELRVALEELLARIPDYAVDTDALVYDNVSVRTVQQLHIAFDTNAGIAASGAGAASNKTGLAASHCRSPTDSVHSRHR